MLPGPHKDAGIAIEMQKGERRLCLEDVLAVGKVDLALVLTLGDAGALVLLR